MIVFHGSSRHAAGATYRQINDGIDRVTGDWGGDLGCDELVREQSLGDTLAEMQASATDVF